jgi:LuxR family transcriptional regulator, maltose regulon positive regulatory protein
MRAPPHRTSRRGKRRAAAAPPVKITRPALRRVYRRVPLFRLLDRARRTHGATWIAAPAGSGKTTLVASYVQDRKLPCLWYQMDAGDQDLASFFHYLGLAVAQAAPRYRQPLPKLTPEYLAGVPVFARNFFRELGARVRAPFLIVFDNLHELAADARFHEILREGLSELPRGGHAVLISRAEPPEAYARMRVNRQLAQPDWQLLRLTETESRALVRLLGQVSADPQIESLHRRCEGWLAGLILLLEGSGGGTEPAQARRTAGTQTLFDYFAAEVFARRPSEVREFLMLTALFPSFTADMAQALTGNARAHVLLNDLVRQHHFTERRVQPSDVYQYHPLFLEFLRAKARASWDDAQLGCHRRRAAAILEQAGQLEQALAIYLDVGDAADATRVILSQAPELAAAGRLATLSELIGRLPSGLEENPWLLYWRALCGLPFAPAAARGDLERAYAKFEELADATGSYCTWAAIVDSVHIEWTDVTVYDRWIAVFEELRARHPSFPSLEVEMRAVFAIVGALTNRHLNHPSLPAWLERADELLRSAPSPSQPVWWELQLLWFFLWMGWMDRAESTGREIASVQDESKAPPLLRLLRRTYLATCQWIMGDPRLTARFVAEGLRIADEHGLPFGTFQLLGQGVLASLCLGDAAAAAAFLERMHPFLSGRRQLDGAFYGFLESMVSAHRGELAGARAIAEKTSLLARDSGQPFMLALCIYVSAVVALLQDDLSRAEAELRTLSALAEDKQSRAILFWCRIAEAALLLRRQQHETALPTLAEALALSSALRGHALPWFPHAELARLYGFALRHGVETEHVKGQIRRFGILPPEDAPGLEAWPFPVKIHTLGRFAVLTDDKPLKSSGKGQKKPLELLKALIAFGGGEVREDKLTDALWPDSQADNAAFALTTTVHRLRRLIGESSLGRRGGCLRLDPRRCWVDVWALERDAAAVERSSRAARPDALADAAARLVALYRGPFLNDDAEQPWVLSARERLRSKFVRAVISAATALAQAGRRDEAVQCLEKGLEVDPLAEECYRRLMQAHVADGHQAEALAVYHRCRQMLAAHLGLEPSADIEAMRRRIQPA